MKLPCSLRGLLASLTACTLLLGCHAMGPRGPGHAPFGSLAQITAISPDATRDLRPGDKVELKVDVRYVLTADTGSLMLIVLAADNSAIAQDVVELTRGHGTRTLQARFTVPKTAQIRLYTPLIYQDQDSSSTTDGRSFTVAPR